jgi:hypothetical protein
VRVIEGVPPLFSETPEVQETVQGEAQMSKLKTTLAAVVLSTALTGGAVGLGAATTTSAAGAATSVTAAAPTVAFATYCGGFRRGCGARWINRSKIWINHVTGRVHVRHARGWLKVRHFGN